MDRGVIGNTSGFGPEIGESYSSDPTNNINLLIMKEEKAKDINRLKRVYNSLKSNLFIKDNNEWRLCTSFREFLSLDWVKRFKNVGKFKKHPLEKEWLKHLNKRRRSNAKKEIQEGIQEYENKYDEI